MASVNNSDFFLINRNDVSFKVQSENLMAYLEDTDYMLINRSDVTLKINGADVRASLASGSPLSPAVPPFGGLATTETVLSSADGKVEFSLDGVTYSTNLTVPLNTFYYVDWGTDILSAVHGDPYSAQITTNFTDLGLSSTIDFDINAIDKLPDPFTFTPLTSVEGLVQYTSNIVSPLETINAPTQIWVTSDAPSFELRVGDGTWFNPPALPGSAYVSQNQEIQVRHTTGGEGDTPYSTTVFIGHGTNAGEFESADFITTTAPKSINTPTITSPAASGVSPTFETVTSSAFVSSGAVGPHTSTDWQIASDAYYTTIVQESLDDTSNLTSWTRPFLGLEWGNTFYIRVRYKDNTGTVSPWGELAVTIQDQDPTFDQSATWQLTNSHNNYYSWTVPEGVGTIRVECRGRRPRMYNSDGFYGANGGIIQATYKVWPKETFRIYNVYSTAYFGEDADFATDKVLLIAGSGGGPGKKSSGNKFRGQGGLGGGLVGGNGQQATSLDSFESVGSVGTGGTQSAGGSPGSGGGAPGRDVTGLTPAAAGQQWLGGAGVDQNTNAGRNYGGQGGAGWFGGGGGGVFTGGGGGSSYVSSNRESSLVKNEQGTFNGRYSQVFLEY